MDIAKQIAEGRASIGIELGSTRIKAVLIGEDLTPLSTGAYDWENKLENGIWTYSLDDVWAGMRGSFKSLSDNTFNKYGVRIETACAIGISAMMHGYLAFDKDDNQLAEFRTWRNTSTGQAAETLTQEFDFNIPQRWSIAHLYQAILNNEPHVKKLCFFTTLAGYVHWRLTGRKVLGIGDASGMFPIDPHTNYYNKQMAARFSELVKDNGFGWELWDVLPDIVGVGENAGTLTESGARLLDPTGTLKAGISFCPPEGDAQTGMVATNSIAPRTGNVSAGTSIFAMAVLEHGLQNLHREIDIVQTPCGNPVAMVHCNNCTTDLDSWVRLFADLLKTVGAEVPKPVLYDKLYEAALSGEADCDGILSYNYHSGEHITGITEGRPLIVRNPEAAFNIPNFMRTLVYSCMATLKIGMDILLGDEKVGLDKMLAHGGLFKSPVTGQRFLAAALGVPVALTESAGEGGAWGIALLAAYQARRDKDEKLVDFLNNRVFAGLDGSVIAPIKADADGFNSFMEKYKKGLEMEKSAAALGL